MTSVAKRLVAAAAFGSAVLAAQAASAATYTWNTTGSASSPIVYGNERSFDAIPGPGSKIMKARAYSTTNSDGTGAFKTAFLALYSGGIGITSQGESTSSPQHAVDNNGPDEFVVFEFDSDNTNPTGLRLGWVNTDSDLQVWIGGSGAGLNLTTDCSGACSVGNLTSTLGFAAALTFNNVGTSALSLGTTLTGRYMIVAAKANSNANDYFKIGSITGSQTTRVPEPSSLALMLGALAGLGMLRRRAQRA